MMHGQQNVK